MGVGHRREMAVEPTLICVRKHNGEKRRGDEGGEDGKNGGKRRRGRKMARGGKQRYNIGQPLEHNNTERDEY